jgi:hypothetical protein
VTLVDIVYPTLVLLLTKIIWFCNLSNLSVPDEGYSRNALCALNHKLPVEYGRWKNIPKELRICHLYNTEDLGVPLPIEM